MFAILLSEKSALGVDLRARTFMDNAIVFGPGRKLHERPKETENVCSYSCIPYGSLKIWRSLTPAERSYR